MVINHDQQNYWRQGRQSSLNGSSFSEHRCQFQDRGGKHVNSKPYFEGIDVRARSHSGFSGHARWSYVGSFQNCCRKCSCPGSRKKVLEPKVRRQAIGAAPFYIYHELLGNRFERKPLKDRIQRYPFRRQVMKQPGSALSKTPRSASTINIVSGQVE